MNRSVVGSFTDTRVNIKLAQRFSLTLCAVVFLGLWIRLVPEIHDLEDQREVPRGPYPPFS
jgi:hypothetical protein